ncbi:MAG: PAS domain S-box protein [Bacteroidota bacterium]
MKFTGKTKEELIEALNTLQQEHNDLRALYKHDISTLRNTEEKLKFSEEKYRMLLDGSSYGILVIDVETQRFLFSNPAICTLFGYTDEELQMLSIEDLVPKESLNLVMSEFASQMRGEKPISLAQPCQKKDGTIFFADISGTPIVLNGKNCSVGFFNDVSDRKKTDEALQLSEEKYRRLFENVQDVFYQIDLAGVFQDISPSIKHFSEFNREEIIGTHVSDLYYDQVDRELFLNEIKKKGVIRDFELKIRTKSGEKRFTSINASLIVDADGKPNHIDGAIRDITDRKIAEDKIREKEIQFRKLSSNLPDLIFQFTKRPDGTYCVPIASEGIKNIFGCSPEDVIEDFAPISSVIFPEDAERVINDIEYSAKHLTYFTCEFRVQIPGKPIQWIFSRSTPEKLSDGSVTWYGFNANITEMKQTELELVKAKEKAEESDRLKSTFLANMSHEIRTPMNGILGFAELLKEPQLTGEEQQEYISIIGKSGKRMLNIINDIVSISKIESGQMEVSVSETNINEQIEYIYNVFKPEVERKGLHLIICSLLPSKEAFIKSDREKLFAILTNLVNNSIKYTLAGSIQFGVERKCDFLEFFVKDTGKGVPENQQKIIFERFRQSNDLITQPYEGAGLGLSISKAYVEMLGGKIWLESELGKGSTFYFTIPMNADVELKPSIINISSNLEADHKGKDLKILITEDDEDSVFFLSNALKTYGKEILIVGTGFEAVEACRNNPDIDLVMMDIRMPELDGYTATRQIRKFNNDVIIIAQTAFAMTGDRQKAIAAGCNDYISKPIDRKILMGLIRKHLKV